MATNRAPLLSHCTAKDDPIGIAQSRSEIPSEPIAKASIKSKLRSSVDITDVTIPPPQYPNTPHSSIDDYDDWTTKQQSPGDITMAGYAYAYENSEPGMQHFSIGDGSISDCSTKPHTPPNDWWTTDTKKVSELAKSVTAVQSRVGDLDNFLQKLHKGFCGLETKGETLDQVLSNYQMHKVLEKTKSLQGDMNTVKDEIGALQRRPLTSNMDAESFAELERMVTASAPWEYRLQELQTSFNDKTHQLKQSHSQQQAQLQREIRQWAKEVQDLKRACRDRSGPEKDRSKEYLDTISRSHNKFVNRVLEITDSQGQRLDITEGEQLKHAGGFKLLEGELKELQDEVRTLRRAKPVELSHTDDAIKQQHASTESEIRKLKILIQSQERRIDTLTKERIREREDTDKELEDLKKGLSALRVAVQRGDATVKVEQHAEYPVSVNSKCRYVLA
ncbi:MAG: hypothetical protein Q9197_005160 [Variospora fuerteventurae]